MRMGLCSPPLGITTFTERMRYDRGELKLGLRGKRQLVLITTFSTYSVHIYMSSQLKTLL
jgi:hypothetical protein